VPARQDQKTAVIGDQREPPILRAKVPANPAIPHAAFQRRARETELRHPLVTPRGDVPERLANLGECAQIVVARHLGLIARFFGSLDRAHVKLGKRVVGRVCRFHSARYSRNRGRCSAYGPNSLVSPTILARANPPWYQVHQVLIPPSASWG
jgi:hypothetical protein